MFKYVKSRDSKKNVNSTASETAEAISILSASLCVGGITSLK